MVYSYPINISQKSEEQVCFTPYKEDKGSENKLLLLSNVKL